MTDRMAGGRRGGRMRGLALPAALGVAAAMLLAGCLPPAPKPTAPENAIIGLTVTNRWDVGGRFGATPQWIHLVRWNDKDDIMAQKEIVTTNFQRNERTYVINAKPGRYSVIATSEVVWLEPQHDPTRAVVGRDEARAIPVSMVARRMAMDKDQGPSPGEVVLETTYLSEPSIRGTTVVVQPGGFTFLGNLDIDRDVHISDGDRAQKHFHPLRNPKLLNLLGVEVTPTQFHASRSTKLKQQGDKAAEQAFLAKAVEDFKDTAWEAIVQKRLAELGGN